MPIIKNDTIILNEGGTGAAGVTECIAGDGININNPTTTPTITNIGVTKLTSSSPAITTDADTGEIDLNFVPLVIGSNRIEKSTTLPAMAQTIIVSETTSAPITITLPLASDYPQGDTLFTTEIINASNHNVTIKIIDDSDFYRGRPKQIVLVAGVREAVDVRLTAFNYPAAGGLPASAGWAPRNSIPVFAYGLYEGAVPMSTFDPPGEPIAYREGDSTDNAEVIELESTNQTRFLIKKGGRLRVKPDLELDAQQSSPPWNATLKARVFRNGAYVDVGLISVGGTGNFGGEDAWLSKEYYFDAEPGDELEHLLINNEMRGVLKIATIKIYTDS